MNRSYKNKAKKNSQTIRNYKKIESGDINDYCYTPKKWL